MAASQAKKQPQQVEYDAEDDDALYVTRMPSSVRKYIQPVERDTLDDAAIEPGPFIQRRRSSGGANTNTGMASKAVTPKVAIPNRKVERPRLEVGTGFGHSVATSARRFPVMAVILGMLVMAALAFMLSSLGSWWQMHQDDATYGRPRTFQVEAIVGHADSAGNPSHFIFLNLNRHVEIIEFPGGDATHAHIYLGPTLFGDGQDLTPITGEFRDVNGDGKPDMIVHIQDQRLVFINDGTQFRPQQPGEHVNL